MDARERLATSYALDRLWRETMGLPAGDSKEGPLRLVAQLLEREGVPYALIGDVAVQLHTAEPRSTLDIDLAVPTYADIPRQALLAAGFEHTGRHEHSDNWRAAPLEQRTAVQFSAEDEGIADAVKNAGVVDLADDVRLRVASVADLIVLKLAAAVEPARRPRTSSSTRRSAPGFRRGDNHRAPGQTRARPVPDYWHHGWQRDAQCDYPVGRRHLFAAAREQDSLIAAHRSAIDAPHVVAFGWV